MWNGSAWTWVAENLLTYIGSAEDVMPGSGALCGDTTTGGLNINYTSLWGVDNTAAIDAIQAGDTVTLKANGSTIYEFVVDGVTDHSANGYMMPYPASNTGYVAPQVGTVYTVEITPGA